MTTWQPVDCHAHTTMSDGALSVEALIERARSLGVRPGVADHVSRDVSLSIKSVDELRRYLDTLEQYDVLRGAEFCCHDTLWREVPEELFARFTHCVGSLHAVHLDSGERVHAFARTPRTSLEVRDYMLAFVRGVEELASTMPVDVFAHPTLITIPFRKHPVDELWTDEIESRLVDALAEHGIAFEISNRYPPHPRIVKRAVDRGVRLSLGSDGHTAQQVADVARPLAMARAAGVDDADIYDPVAHGSRALTVKRSATAHAPR